MTLETAERLADLELKRQTLLKAKHNALGQSQRIYDRWDQAYVLISEQIRGILYE
jgi:hypothetical protein